MAILHAASLNGVPACLPCDSVLTQGNHRALYDAFVSQRRVQSVLCGPTHLMDRPSSCFSRSVESDGSDSGGVGDDPSFLLMAFP